MMRYLHIAGPLGAPLLLGMVLALTGCGLSREDAANAMKIEGSDMAAEAAREYQRLAYFEDVQMWDRASAMAFREKALHARNGWLEVPAEAEVGGNHPDRDDVREAYRILNGIVAAGGGAVAPKAAGQALAQLDCWAEQTVEGDQPRHIAFCRDGYRQYLQEAAERVAATGRAVPPPLPVRSFSVSFALGSAELSPSGRAVVQEVAHYVAGRKDYRILLGGHADRSGSQAFNQHLSKARADTVARGLRGAGVRQGAISTIGFGETFPRSQTPDGQRSPVNRRVEIVVGESRAM